MASYYDQESESTAEYWEWPYGLEAFEAAEAAIDLPNDQVSEILVEHEPQMFDDSAELAEALREALHEVYQKATTEELQEALFDILETMTLVEGFDLIMTLGRISKARQIRCLRAPCPGPAPAGATPTANASPEEGSAAPVQLPQLTRSPDMHKSLPALGLGSHGRKSQSAGHSGPLVPLDGFMNALITLASNIAVDADELLRDSAYTPTHLLGSVDELLVAPEVPVDRGQMLYEALSRAENRWLIAEATPRRPWPAYVPFTKGTELLVAYETWVRNWNIGNGAILKRTSNLLKVRIHIDKWDLFNVPETDATIAIEYRREGAGNRAEVVVNGSRYTNKNVTIRSGRKAREVFMSITILGQKVDRITVTREDSDEARLKFKAGSEEHVLVLTKKQYS